MRWLLVVVVLLPLVGSIEYHCKNDQVLVVQSFGSNTIRMHCQKLNLCGVENLKCAYENEQSHCGGLVNFVSSVHQETPTSYVAHQCCHMDSSSQLEIIHSHNGNDCFIYDLPDGTDVVTTPPPQGEHIGSLKSVDEIPQLIDKEGGYRLRLFQLKDKSPPALLVKGIERTADGYRITICRPNCDFDQKVEKNQQRDVKVDTVEGTGWKAVSWSSWTSTTWTTWARSAWNDEKNGGSRDEQSERTSEPVQKRQRVKETEKVERTDEGNGVHAIDRESTSDSPSSKANDGSVVTIHIHGLSGKQMREELGDSRLGTGGVGTSPGNDSRASGPNAIAQNVITINNGRGVNGEPIDLASLIKVLQGKAGDGENKEGEGGATSEGNAGEPRLPQNRGTKGSGDDGNAENKVRDGGKGGEGGNEKKKTRDGGQRGDAGDGEEREGARGREGGGKSGKGRKNNVDEEGDKDGDKDGDNGDANNSSPDKGDKSDGGPKSTGNGNEKTTESAEDLSGGKDQVKEKNNEKGTKSDKDKGSVTVTPSDKAKTHKDGSKQEGSSEEELNNSGKSSTPDGSKEQKGAGDDNEKNKNGAEKGKKKDDSVKKPNNRGKQTGEGDGGPDADGETDDGDTDSDKLNGELNNAGHSENQAPNSKNNGEKDGDNGKAGDRDRGGKGENPSETDTAELENKKGNGENDEGKNGNGGKPGNAPETLEKDSSSSERDSNSAVNGSVNKSTKPSDGAESPKATSSPDSGDSESGSVIETEENGLSETNADKAKDKDGKDKQNGKGDNGVGGSESKLIGDTDDKLKEKFEEKTTEGDVQETEHTSGEEHGEDKNDDGQMVSTTEGAEGQGEGDSEEELTHTTSDESEETVNQTEDSGRPRRIQNAAAMTTATAATTTVTAAAAGSATGGGGGSGENSGETAYAPGNSGEVGIRSPQRGGGKSGEDSGNNNDDNDDDDTDNDGVDDTGEINDDGLGDDALGDISGSYEYIGDVDDIVSSGERRSLSSGEETKLLRVRVQRKCKGCSTCPTKDSKCRSRCTGCKLKSKDSSGSQQNDEQKKPAPTCFPGDSIVMTTTGKKRMDELQVGDTVMVPAAKRVTKYEMVEMFYHRVPSQKSVFITLTTAGGRSLSITPRHLIPVMECDTINKLLNKTDGIDQILRAATFAYKAQIGLCTVSISDSGDLISDRIVKIGRRIATGIYSPITVEGGLIVDGILTSCFAEVESHFTQKLLYDFITGFYNLFSMSSLSAPSTEAEVPSLVESMRTLGEYVIPMLKF